MKLSEIKILEAAVGASPTLEPYSFENCITLLKKNCSDGLKLLADDKIFWRGDFQFNLEIKKNPNKCFVVDPSKTKRKSDNTTNQYTEIFDNHPDMKDWPKRSASYIASTNKRTAKSFGNNPSVLVPYNGVKIGVVNQDDLWAVYSEFSFEHKPGDIDLKDINRLFTKAELNTWEDFVKFDKKLKANDTMALLKLQSLVRDDEKTFNRYKDNFLELLIKYYSPDALGFTLGTTANIKWNHDTEVWISGPCVLIPENLLTKVKDEIKI